MTIFGLLSDAQPGSMDELVTALKWIVGILTPVVGGLCVAVVTLWVALRSKSKEYADLIREKDMELSAARQKHLDDVKEMNGKYHEGMGWVKQSLDLLSNSLKE